MAKEVFISYSRIDYDKVIEIKKHLDKELGIDCWMDLDGIESGDQFEDVIINAICKCDTILFMMSANSMQSEWALDELDFAKHEKKRIVLVSIDNTEMSGKFYFRYHKYDTITWDNQLQREKLIRNLKSWLDVNGSNVPPADTSTKTTVLQDEGPTSPEEQDQLANEYYNGWNGKQQDDAEAVKWYQKAADQGDVEAQFCLGVMYYKGQGIAEDYAEAVKWWREAAEQGHAKAQNNLGVMYEAGRGVVLDHAEAAKWYRKAAEQGDEFAKHNANTILSSNDSIITIFRKLKARREFQRTLWMYDR